MISVSSASEKNFQSSLEITSLLHDMGAAKVISKANTEIHAKFLLRNGADEVYLPERDSAQKLATRYSVDNIFDFIELTKILQFTKYRYLKAG